MAEKPTAAFILSLIGTILILLNAVFVFFLVTLGEAIWPFLPVAGIFIGILGSIGLVIGAIVLVGALMINSENKSRVTTGSILVLVFSIISFFMGGGFIIGFILCLAGSILGLTWHPSTPPPSPPSPY